ncbi:glycosyl transferase [Acetobacter pomorum]|uniref:Glycosyl transferase n=1 Tax=Acetobacter pomorum TaxID=65959 RepID=A0A2G4RE26_9PROT|nr:glycosyl transferase [Acetobacter pomorum]PHY93995.1 glycosyl transferase [Acetobacter pomorum]GBR50481.1 glycosyltransferase [Acetobacter pomorum DSM 11825]
MANRASEALWYPFDAAWYRTEYGTIMDALTSFSDRELEHWYKTEGAPSGHSPNRYFNEEWYRMNCSEAAEAIANGTCTSGFEHYCNGGYKHFSPHYLFSERYYLKRYPDIAGQTQQSGKFVNGYDHFLRHGDTEKRSGHLFFDPDVYLKNKPSDLDTNSLTPFMSLLHSPVTLPNSIALSDQFDPAWYGALKPDALMAVEYGFAPNVLYQFLSNFTPDRF